MALEKEKNVAFVETMSKIDKLPSETVWGIALGFCFLSFLSMQLPIGYITEHHYAIVDVGNIFGYYKMQGFWIFFLYVFLSFLWYLIFLRLIKRYIIRKEIGMHFKDSSHMVYFLKFLRDVYRNRSVTIQTAAELMLYGLGNYLNIVCLFPKGGFYLMIFWINFILIQGTLLSVFLNRSIWQKRITETLGHMTQGDVGVKVDTTNMKGTILQLAEEINYLGSGLEKAIEKATINERMKTELLTNVSHDIKTPLTSIVNYVDLLKMTNLSDKKAMEYLKILEEKSIRLKQLTEDLVEAAKANSGNLILEMVSLDLTEFLHQVIGEMEYKFLEKNLEVIALIPDEPIFIEADGNRLWRVFENLMNNAYKYSMSGTRVFVECLEKEEEVSVVIKNISKYPLNLRGSELTERFVRGDASRATEGSGLGLSIARGFIERMDGVLEIKADGDMFKAMVHFKRNSGLL